MAQRRRHLLHRWHQHEIFWDSRRRSARNLGRQDGSVEASHRDKTSVDGVTRWVQRRWWEIDHSMKEFARSCCRSAPLSQCFTVWLETVRFRWNTGLPLAIPKRSVCGVATEKSTNVSNIEQRSW